VSDLLLRRTFPWSLEPAEAQVTDGPDASRVTVIERERQDGVARMWHGHGPDRSHLDVNQLFNSAVINS
jgi:hypothetical protein